MYSDEIADNLTEMTGLLLTEYEKPLLFYFTIMKNSKEDIVYIEFTSSRDPHTTPYMLNGKNMIGIWTYSIEDAVKTCKEYAGIDDPIIIAGDNYRVVIRYKHGTEKNFFPWDILYKNGVNYLK